MRKGLTLIEIIIVIALMVILVGVYFLAANPAGQLASSRNSERLLHLQAIMNYIQQNIADNNNQFLCLSGPIPTSTVLIASSPGSYNIAPCLITNALPFDPATSSAHYASVSDYDTGYTILMDASGTITLGAPAAELGKIISVMR